MIKLRSITITGSSLDGICGIKLSFTDNISSPLFESKKKKPATYHQIDTNKQIKYIEARVRDADEHHLPRINQLKFLDSRSDKVVHS